jgi:hypothetical protein
VSGGRDLQAERDHAEWRGWFEAQGYTDGNFEADSMAEAFLGGMQAQRDLDAAQQPQPVSGGSADGPTLGQIGYETFQAARWPNDPGTGWDHPAAAKARPAWEAAGATVGAHAIARLERGEPKAAPELQAGPCPFDGHDGDHLRLNTHGHWLCAITLTNMLVAADVITDPQPAPGLAAAMAENARLRKVLERLADEDTCVLDDGLGGGAAEELHVRASLARQALGQEILCCTECMVSLGIDEDEDEDEDENQNT